MQDFFVCLKEEVKVRNVKYKSYDELPLMLDVKTVKDILGISQTSVYELVKQKDFPSIKISGRYIVPKDKFREWIDKQTTT